MDTFDLIQTQKDLNSANSMREVYVIWDRVCGLYDKGRIGSYELQEVKDVVEFRISEFKATKALLDAAQDEIEGLLDD